MRRIHYAWIMAAVTFIALMGAAGFRATPSVLIVPLQNEFGWNRAVISVAVSPARDAAKDFSAPTA